MLPQTHFLFPFFLGIVLVKLELFSWEYALLAGVVGVLVDFDHYIEHIIYAKKNKFSLRATWNNSVKSHKFNQRSFIHYTFGALIITILLLVLLIFNWQLALVIALGYYSHLFLDFAHLTGREVWRIRLGRFYLKESLTEVVIDLFLLLGIVVVWFV